MCDQDITDLDIQALVDGEFDDATRRRVMAAVMTCPEKLARLDELLRQKAWLRAWLASMRLEWVH